MDRRPAPPRARAGGLHPRQQGLPAPRAAGRPPRADPAAGDRAPRRGGARACPPGARVVDVGTGSGAIALALEGRAAGPARSSRPTSARTRSTSPAPTRRGSGLDVTFVEGDLTAGLEVDAVVSNPPYVEAGASLMPEVGALRAAAGALRRARRPRRDPPPGRGGDRAPFLALEHGEGQADAIEALARAAGFGEVERIRDLAGIERVAGRAAARRRGDATDATRRSARASPPAASPSSPPTRSTGSRAIPENEAAVAQALRAQGPPAGEAGGGDVLRPRRAGATSAACCPAASRCCCPTRSAASRSRARTTSRRSASASRSWRRSAARSCSRAPTSPAGPMRSASRTCREASARAPTS